MPLISGNGLLTTVGPGTITAALLEGQTITRTGPTGAFADTFDTAANILASLNVSASGYGGSNFQCLYLNTTAFVATLTAPAGGNFTLQAGYAAATAAIPATTGARLLVQVSVSGAVTITVLYRFSLT